MNKTTNDTANASSMETLWKVLRFIGKYRFLLILKHYSGSCIRYSSIIRAGTFW